MNSVYEISSCDTAARVTADQGCRPTLQNLLGGFPAVSTLSTAIFPLMLIQSTWGLHRWIPWLTRAPHWASSQQNGFHSGPLLHHINTRLCFTVGNTKDSSL